MRWRYAPGVDASGMVSSRNEAGYVSAEDMHRVHGVVLLSRFAAVVSTPQWLQAVQQGRRSLAATSVHRIRLPCNAEWARTVGSRRNLLPARSHGAVESQVRMFASDHSRDFAQRC